MKAFLKIGFIEPNASQKRTGPGACSLTSSRAAEDKCVHYPGVDGLFICNALWNNMSIVLKEFTLVTDKGKGKDDAGGHFYDGRTVCK